MTHTIEDAAHWRERARYYGEVYDVDFFERAIEVESDFKVHAVSPAGAVGIAQFMPPTAAGRGIDPLDPEQALRGSASLFREYLDTYKSPALALAAYNAGPGAVEKFRKGAQLPEETRNYVRTILGSGSTSDQPRGGGGPLPGGSCGLDASSLLVVGDRLRAGHSPQKIASDLTRELGRPITVECLRVDAYRGAEEIGRLVDAAASVPVVGGVAQRIVSFKDADCAQVIVTVAILGTALFLFVGGVRRMVG